MDVSIIIPAWNASAFIGTALASALRQRGVTLEVVVADDASTDATADAVAACDDPRVRYLRLPVNRGPAAARNAALTITEGRWIAVLDADDTMMPDRLARLVAVAEDHQLDIVADNLWVERGINGKAARSLMLSEPMDGRLMPVTLAEYLRANLLFGRQPGHGYLKPLFRADFLTQRGIRYDESLRIGEDFHLVLEALALDARCARHASAGYVYAARRGSISHRLSGFNAAAMIDADRRFIARFGTALTDEELAAATAHLRSLTDGAAFIAMVDCIKQRRVGGLLSQLTRHPRAVRHFSMPMRAAFARFRGAAA